MGDLADYSSRVNEVFVRQRMALSASELRRTVDVSSAMDPHEVQKDLFKDALLGKLKEADLEDSLLDIVDTSSMKDENIGDESVSHQQNSPIPSHLVSDLVKQIAWEVTAGQPFFDHEDNKNIQCGIELNSKLKSNVSEFESECATKENLKMRMSNNELKAVATKWLKTIDDGKVEQFLLSDARRDVLVPRLRWSRWRRVPPTSQQIRENPELIRYGVVIEKVVYIYGDENISKFLNWRRQRQRSRSTFGTSNTKQQQKVSGTVTPVTDGGRCCRKCRMPGHIASNPLCPLYEKKSGGAPPSDSSYPSASATPVSVGTAAVTLVKEELSAHPALDEMEVGAGSGAMSVGGLPLGATRLTARRQKLLHERHREMAAAGSVATESLVKFVGTREGAIEELNQNLMRVILALKPAEKKWFWSKVSENDAPHYYTLVKEPMWLEKILDKTKNKEYLNLDDFKYDIDLIHKNCCLYNPEGHWIRPLAEQLKAQLESRLESQEVWLNELGRAISPKEN